MISWSSILSGTSNDIQQGLAKGEHMLDNDCQQMKQFKLPLTTLKPILYVNAIVSYDFRVVLTRNFQTISNRGDIFNSYLTSIAAS